MRKLFLFFVLISGCAFGQMAAKTETYNYSKYSNQDIVRSITKTYIFALEMNGWSIKKELFNDTVYDFRLSLFNDTKNGIEFGVTYIVNEDTYSATLKGLTFTIDGEIIHADDTNPRHLKLIAIATDAVFKDYQNEIHSF